MSEISQEKFEKPEGIIVPTEGGLSVIREIAQEQMMLVNLCHKQNMFMTKILVFFLSIFALILVSGVVIYFYYKPNIPDKDEIKKEIESYKAELGSKIATESLNFYQKYQQDIQRLYMQGKDSNKELIDFILRIKQENEEKLLKLEKEKLSFQQTIESLNQKIKNSTILLTKAELEILKIQNENKSLIKESESLKKKVENYKKEIEYLKAQLSEKLTPEEKETLQKDLNNDN